MSTWSRFSGVSPRSPRGSGPPSPPCPSCPEEDLTTPYLRKAPTPPGHEDVDTAVIAGEAAAPAPPRGRCRYRCRRPGLSPAPLRSPAVVITLVFLTLLTVLVVIGIYLYRNQGSYRTYEQPEPDAAPRDEAPSKEKEEYFI